LWDKLPSHTTLLEDVDEDNYKMAGERQTDKELVVANITDEFFDDDGVAISTEAESEATAELNPSVLAALTGLATGDNLEDGNEEEEEDAEADGVEVEITVGDCQFGKVTKMKVNPMCLKHVCTLGCQKMTNSNVSASRHRRKQQDRRKRQFLQISLMNMLNGTTGNRITELVLRLDTGEQIDQPSFRKKFREVAY
jgi:hypothetical protein